MCYLYLYFTCPLYEHIHILHTFAYIILHYFWKDTTDTDVTGGLCGGDVGGCGAGTRGRLHNSLYLWLRTVCNVIY